MPRGPAATTAKRRAFPLLPSLFWRESYGALIGLMLLTLVLGPYLREQGGSGGAIVLLLIISGLISTTTAGNSLKIRRLIRLAFVPLLAVDLGILLAEPAPWLRFCSILGHLLLTLIAAVAILRRLLHQQHVTVDALLGGITVYLLIGFLYCFLFDLLESAHPGSFLFQGQTIDVPDTGRHLLFFPQLLFFSFGTLSTVGYGEISATWSLARSLFVLEALTGQVYMATLLAILVSSYIADRHAARDAGHAPEADAHPRSTNRPPPVA
jgi:hypothetical protein